LLKNKIIPGIDRIVQYITDKFLVISGALTIIMSLAATYGVGRRYLFHSPEPYSYEISTILLVACVVFALAGLQHQQRHLRVDFITTKLRPSTQLFLSHIFTPIIALFYVLIVMWKSGENAWYSMIIGELSQSVWEEPLFPTKMMVPIGMGLLGLVLIVQLIQGILQLWGGRRPSAVDSIGKENR
jgi:TRAP-type C4-dicarboxylate transport system permease small subunit